MEKIYKINDKTLIDEEINANSNAKFKILDEVLNETLMNYKELIILKEQLFGQAQNL